MLQVFFALLAYSEDRPYKKYDNPIYPGNLVELRLKEALPPDAADYVSRYRQCIHWRGEDAYDAARAKDIQKGIEKSCSDLEERKEVIGRKYPHGSKESRLIQSILEEVEKGESTPSFIWNDPEGKSKVLDEYFEAQAQYVVHELEKQIPEYEAAVSAFKKHGSSRQKDESEERRLKEKLDMIIFRLNVQKKYLAEVIKNSRRLHPLTRKEIANSEIKLKSTLTPK
jgi:hypothetical protein